MPISDMPILSALRTRMQWHQERQRVLAENIANSDTPKFKPRELVEPNLKPGLGGPMGSLPMMRTSAAHMRAVGGESFASAAKGYETRPAGNAVNLEDEMQKSASNQMDFAAATSLYSRSLGLLKTAIGKR
jgi:flagellar basal-body rod protein FlgB